jgi:hypothetical protein
MEIVSSYGKRSLFGQVTTTIFIFTDGIFCRYLHYYSVGNSFTNKITDEITPSMNPSSVIFCPSVSPLVINKLFYRWKRHAKKNYPLHSVGISLGRSVCTFIGNYLKILKKNLFYKTIK